MLGGCSLADPKETKPSALGFLSGGRGTDLSLGAFILLYLFVSRSSTAWYDSTLRMRIGDFSCTCGGAMPASASLYESRLRLTLAFTEYWPGLGLSLLLLIIAVFCYSELLRRNYGLNSLRLVAEPRLTLIMLSFG